MKKNPEKVKKEKNNFLKDSVDELKMVTWPTKKEMIKYSITTIVFIFVLSLFLYLVNYLSIFFGAK